MTEMVRIVEWREGAGGGENLKAYNAARYTGSRKHRPLEYLSLAPSPTILPVSPLNGELFSEIKPRDLPTSVPIRVILKSVYFSNLYFKFR